MFNSFGGRSKNQFDNPSQFASGNQFKGNFGNDYSSGGFKSPNNFSSMGQGLLQNFFSKMGRQQAQPQQQMQSSPMMGSNPMMGGGRAMMPSVPPMQQSQMGMPNQMGQFGGMQQPGPTEIGMSGMRSPMQGGPSSFMDYFRNKGKQIYS